MRTELYINGTRLDLKEELQMALTLMIADIRQPETRKGSFSKTIKLVGSKTINKLLGGIFEISEEIQTSGIVNFVPDFNPNLKAEAVVYCEGLEQFRGNMKLMTIERSQEDYSFINYNVVLFGEVANIFSAIGDSKMTDLSLSEYNHTYNKAIQKATWTSTNYGNGYVYPMINYGGISPVSWDVNNFYPATYLKTYIDKIFSYAGYTYTSTFFDSTFFKHIIIPYSGDKFTITSSQIATRLFNAYTSAQTSGVVTSPLTIPFNAETSDPSNQFDTATNIFTAANSGTYSFYSSGVSTFDAVTPLTSAGSGIQIWVQALVTGASAGSYTLYGASANTSATYVQGATVATFTFQGWTQDIYLNAGDTVKIIQLSIYNSVVGTVGNKISSNSVFTDRITNTTILDGNGLDMASSLPVDVKQSDFLMWVIRRWNLYVEPDKTTPNNLIIDTYDSFYGVGTTRDWTRKVDCSMPMVITPMGELQDRRYRLKDADDTDYWNKFYTDKWKETYGEKNLDITNDFLKSTNTNEIGFAPTPSIGSSSHDRIIPEIFSLSNSGIQTPIRGKLRLLYWGGAMNTNYSWSYTSTISGTTTETTYPYCGHLDNPYSPTLDLSFAVPREIYFVNPYGATSYTTDNTYNRYHSKFLTEITDRNSKIVSLYVRLRALDIYNLSFRDIIFIDGINYRLQKVIDYNPSAEQVTKVELLKINTASTFTPVIHTIDFSYNAMIDVNNRAPTAGGNVGVGSSSNVSMNMIVGTNNYVSDTARGSFVSGNGNRIGNNTSNISIFNSSGVSVADGLTNVNVVSTNNISVTQSNVNYINGVLSANVLETTTTITSAQILSLNSIPIQLIPPVSGSLISVVSGWIENNFSGSTPYDTNTNIELYIDTADVYVCFEGKMLLSTIPRKTQLILNPSPVPETQTQLLNNKGLYINVISGNPLNGNFDIRIHLFYQLLPVQSF